ncbi:MAG: hypothetical protein ABSE16_08835 [Verrucomicrobiota bacterium]|jgi:hypothetical protein
MNENAAIYMGVVVLLFAAWRRQWNLLLLFAAIPKKEVWAG